VDLRLADDETFWEFSQQDRDGVRTAFGPNPLRGMDLPLHLDGPATSLAYRWLVHDLIEIGWLKDGIVSSIEQTPVPGTEQAHRRAMTADKFGRRGHLSTANQGLGVVFGAGRVSSGNGGRPRSRGWVLRWAT
jgi:hypothetical protein